MPKFRVLVQREEFINRTITKEKWFEVEAEDEDDAKSQAEDLEYKDLESGTHKGWEETGDEEEWDDSETTILEVEELPEKRIPDCPGQMKMFDA